MIGAQLKAYARPTWVALGLFFGAIATYDGVANQLGLPNLGKIVGKTGALLPVWGWLLVIQTVAVIALFDFVRRNVPVTDLAEQPTPNQGYLYLDTKLENVRVDGEINKRDLAKLEAKVSRESERNASAFYALFVREQLSELQGSIEKKAVVLYNTANEGGIYDHLGWSEWEAIHSGWESALTAWLNMARWYCDKVEEKVTSITEDDYRKSKWSVSDSQFPSAEAVRRFKRYRLINERWEGLKGTVNNNVRRVAFEGMTEADVRAASAP